MAREYTEKGFTFLFVYTREAHPGENYGAHRCQEQGIISSRLLSGLLEAGLIKPCWRLYPFFVLSNSFHGILTVAPISRKCRSSLYFMSRQRVIPSNVSLYQCVIEVLWV